MWFFAGCTWYLQPLVVITHFVHGHSLFLTDAPTIVVLTRQIIYNLFAMCRYVLGSRGLEHSRIGLGLDAPDDSNHLRLLLTTCMATVMFIIDAHTVIVLTVESFYHLFAKWQIFTQKPRSRAFTKWTWAGCSWFLQPLEIITHSVHSHNLVYHKCTDSCRFGVPNRVSLVWELLMYTLEARSWAF